MELYCEYDVSNDDIETFVFRQFELLYPEYTEYDLQEEVTAYYKLFYDCDLTDEMYQSLMTNALAK